MEGIPAVAVAAAVEGTAAARTQQLAAVGAGVWHSAAVTSSGDVWTWGRDEFGQLGHGARLDGAFVLMVSSAALPCLLRGLPVPRLAVVYDGSGSKHGTAKENRNRSARLR